MQAASEQVTLLVQYRFALLNLASLEAPLVVPCNGSVYGDDCIFIANDWHGALVPVYLAAKYRPNGTYGAARSIMAIHNLRHQVGAPTCQQSRAPEPCCCSLMTDRAVQCCSAPRTVEPLCLSAHPAATRVHASQQGSGAYRADGCPDPPSCAALLAKLVCKQS